MTEMIVNHLSFSRTFSMTLIGVTVKEFCCTESVDVCNVLKFVFLLLFVNRPLNLENFQIEIVKLFFVLG